MVFIRNFPHYMTTYVVIIHEGAAYVGDLVGGVNENGKAYAKLGSHFSRLTLEYNGIFHKVTNQSTLWSSRLMHDGYPQGLIFNDDGSVSWVHTLSCCCDENRIQPHIRYNGINWSVSKLHRLENIELNKFENDLPKDKGEWEIFGHRNGRNGDTAFSIVGDTIEVAMGAQMPTPANIRFRTSQFGGGIIEWDAVSDTRQYRIFYPNGARMGTTLLYHTITSNTAFNLGLGTHRITVTVEGRRQIINGIITHFACSEPAVIYINFNADGTFSQAQPANF
jgi:hypothetical protein